MQPRRTVQYPLIRIIFLFFFLLLLIPSSLFDSSTEAAEAAVPTESGRPEPILLDFLDEHIQSYSVQASIFSYRPELGDLTDILQSVGVSEIPAVLMPMFSIVIEHSSELDSRLEFGYGQMQLDIPPPISANLTTTLIPISYQLIYRPVLLSEFLPLYLGGGLGFLGASFSGSATDLIEQQGISFDDSSSGTTGYVVVGAEVFRWADTISLNFELKRLLKTVETSGSVPLSVVLDGTAIGFGVRMRF